MNFIDGTNHVSEKQIEPKNNYCEKLHGKIWASLTIYIRFI